MKGTGRGGKMVPKEDSQRYCYEEWMYGKRNKKERWRNKKMCCDQFCTQLESKELTHTNLRLSLPQRWANSWKKSFYFFWEILEGLLKNSRAMTTRGMCQPRRAPDSKFKTTSTNEAEDSLNYSMNHKGSTLLKSYTLKTTAVNRHYTRANILICAKQQSFHCSPCNHYRLLL